MDADLRAFVGQAIPSVLALEVLLFVRAWPATIWAPDELAAVLRHSVPSCDAIMASLASRGLLARRGTGYAYQPDSPALHHLVVRLESAYRERPVAVINAIVGKGA